MPQTVLLRDNRRLSRAEIARAKVICDEAIAWVAGRDAYLEQHAVDRQFALPDANWSYNSSNEFVRLFRRLCEADPQTLALFRGLSQVYSGYNIYRVSGEPGYSAADLKLSPNLDDEIAV